MPLQGENRIMVKYGIEALRRQLRPGVRALIEVKVTPQRDGGFDAVARRLSKYPEVTDLYLVAGHYDLRIEVTGKTLEDVVIAKSRY